MENSIPKLRPDLEIIPASHQGERAVIVRDALGLIKEPVLLQEDALTLVGLIDGRRTVRDIQVEFVRIKRGVLVSLDLLLKLIAELDAAFLLDSGHFRREKEKIVAEYNLQKVRTASHAGVSYPGRRAELGPYLDSLLSQEVKWPSGFQSGKIAAAVAPHIDLEVGKKVYAAAYQCLKGKKPEKIILLGTGHSLQDAYFSLTEKDFETPLGRVSTDKELVRMLEEAGGKAVASHDIAHRQEHSLEFALIFLQHLFGSEFKFVPILCGSFDRCLSHFTRPAQIEGAGEMISALRRSLSGLGTDTLVVASVDFSHIGPKFGHATRAAALLYEAKKHDQSLIAALCGGDVGAFWKESLSVKDKYNVCGFSAMATLLEILPGARGWLLDYDFWQEEPTQSAVSFAAIAFTI
jgi:AmmeMemoRadiSam system protein B